MQKDGSISAFFGAEVELEGQMKFRGAVNIEGRFKGEIAAKGTLIVGDKAELEAEVHVSNVIVMGAVRGNIKADKKIEIQAPGRVVGNIQAPIIEIHPGAVLQGKCLTKTVPQVGQDNPVVIDADDSQKSST